MEGDLAEDAARDEGIDPKALQQAFLVSKPGDELNNLFAEHLKGTHEFRPSMFVRIVMGLWIAVSVGGYCALLYTLVSVDFQQWYNNLMPLEIRWWTISIPAAILFSGIVSLYCLQYIRKSKYILDEEGMRGITVWPDKDICYRWDEMEAYDWLSMNGNQLLVLYPKSDSKYKKPLNHAVMVGQIAKFRSVIHTYLPNRQLEKEEEGEKIFMEKAFEGMSPEQKEALDRSQSAIVKWVARLYMIGSVLLFALMLNLPQHIEIFFWYFCSGVPVSLLLGILFPEQVRHSVYTQKVAGNLDMIMIFPCGFLMLMTLPLIDVMSLFTLRALLIGGGIGLGTTLLFHLFFRAWQEHKRNDRIARLILVFLFGSLYGLFGGLGYNTLYDNAKPQVIAGKVADRSPEEDDQSSKYYSLTVVGLEGAYPEDTISVSWEKYSRYAIGDPITIYVHPGALGIQWIHVGAAPHKDQAAAKDG